jgi:hypothetical protein
MSVVLDHENHIYTNTETGDQYTSVTTFIGLFKKPFDSDFWSKHVAKREGVSQQTILDKWKDVTKIACDRGTKIHCIMEDWIKYKKVPKEHSELAESFTKKTSFVINNDSVVNSEILLYNHDLKLAGTADMIVENKNFFFVLDFKTNKKFNYHSKYNEYYYPPIDHLSHCEHNTYAIQMSIYAYMHELLTGKKCAGLKILYLNEFGGKRFWQEIPCNYMKDTVLSMFNYRKEKLNELQ